MNTSAHSKRIVIIAGPNGAGKTTFAREFLPTDAKLPNFVNADLIAAGLSPFAPKGIKGVSFELIFQGVAMELKGSASQ